MRTTVSIHDHVLERAKEAARRRKCTLGQVVEDALRRTLLNRPSEEIPSETGFTTFKGQGVLPGVNLDSHADLLDRMEHR